MVDADKNKLAILIVDDDVNVTRSLRRSLRNQFQVFTANTADEALTIITTEDIAVVLTDQRMPGLTGVALLEEAQRLRPDAVGIIISGYTDITALVDAINLGTVRGYVPKPWDLSELRERLDKAAHTYQASFLNRDVLHSSAEAVTRMQDEISDLQRMLEQVASGEVARKFIGSLDPPPAQPSQAPNGVDVSAEDVLPVPPDISDGRRLSEAMPDVFKQLTLRYSEVVDLALQQRVYKVSHNLSDELRAISKQLGKLRAGPRDVVEIYSTTLKYKLQGETVARRQAMVEEGRLALLELMGYMITYYRGQLLSSEQRPRP